MNLKKKLKVCVFNKFVFKIKYKLKTYNFTNLKGIENELLTEQKNYKDILNKHEILQKEQIDAKSKLTAEKEKLQR